MTATIRIDTTNLDKLLTAIRGGVKDRIIADGVTYGIFQELGRNGHPSLVPAFEHVTKDLPKAIRMAIEATVSIDDVFNKAANDIATMWAADVNVDTGAYKNSIGAHEE